MVYCLNVVLYNIYIKTIISRFRKFAKKKLWQQFIQQPTHLMKNT